MSQRYVASLGLPITTANSLRNMHRWPGLCTNLFLARMQQENEIQSNRIKNVKKLLINLKSCEPVHQFWHMQISQNHLGYIQMQAFSALEQFYIRNMMVLKTLSVMPVSHSQNPNIWFINWSFLA